MDFVGLDVDQCALIAELPFSSFEETVAERQKDRVLREFQAAHH